MSPRINETERRTTRHVPVTQPKPAKKATPPPVKKSEPAPAAADAGRPAIVPTADSRKNARLIHGSNPLASQLRARAEAPGKDEQPRLVQNQDGSHTFRGGSGDDNLVVRQDQGGQTTIRDRTNRRTYRVDGPVTIEGNGGNDTIRVDSRNGIGANNRIKIDGGAGTDNISVKTRGGVGFNNRVDIDGGEGDDRIRVRAGLQIGFNNSVNVEGGQGNDHVNATGSRNGVNLRGGGGDDHLIGGSGRDHLEGSAGNDRVNGALGDDTLSGGIGDDRVRGGEGNDEAFGNGGNDVVLGGAGDDRLDGGIGDDRINGGGGKDRLEGRAGNDRLRGGRGDDLLTGGDGADEIFGDRGADVLDTDTADTRLDAGNDGDRDVIAQKKGVKPTNLGKEDRVVGYDAKAVREFQDQNPGVKLDGDEAELAGLLETPRGRQQLGNLPDDATLHLGPTGRDNAVRDGLATPGSHHVFLNEDNVLQDVSIEKDGERNYNVTVRGLDDHSANSPTTFRAEFDEGVDPQAVLPSIINDYSESPHELRTSVKVMKFHDERGEAIETTDNPNDFEGAHAGSGQIEFYDGANNVSLYDHESAHLIGQDRGNGDFVPDGYDDAARDDGNFVSTYAEDASSSTGYTEDFADAWAMYNDAVDGGSTALAEYRRNYPARARWFEENFPRPTSPA